MSLVASVNTNVASYERTFTGPIYYVSSDAISRGNAMTLFNQNRLKKMTDATLNAFEPEIFQDLLLFSSIDTTDSLIPRKSSIIQPFSFKFKQSFNKHTSIQLIRFTQVSLLFKI